MRRLQNGILKTRGGLVKYLLVGSILLAVVLAAVWLMRDYGLEEATIPSLNQAQTVWYAHPVLNYHIIVDVLRPDEKRRNEITVENGEITQATVKYWNTRRFRWDEAYDLNYDQAYPFTIPGLYDMVRGAINGSNRPDIRMTLRGDPPFPYRIELGPVWDEGRPVWGTETSVVVKAFQEFP